MKNQPGIPVAARECAQMGEALQAAERALETGDVPVGAALYDADGSLLALTCNNREAANNITGHAEVLAINEAVRQRGDRVLADCTLVVTLEPCVMCAGAILAARVGRVIFGAWDDKAGAAGSVYDLLRDGRLPHPVPEVIAGVRESECATLLQNFFSARRENSVPLNKNPNRS